MKTKVGSLSVIICFIIGVFFCILACDNGSVSDSSSVAKSNGLVKVSLSVGEKTSAGMQKSISVSSDIVLGSLIYKYNAVPQWVGSGIYGAADWTTINYSDGMSLGYFTPGLWKFGVRLIKIVDGDEVIVYEGYSGIESISTSSVAIDITVSKMVDQAPKSVTISVTAPTVDGEALSISYTGTASSEHPIPANIAGRANGLTTFEYSFSEETIALDSGNYTFTLSHPLGGSGAAVAIELRPGEQVQITGHIDNGVWQVGAVTVKIHTMDINTNVELCTVYANTVSAAAGEKVSFYLVPYDGAVLKDGTTISVTYESDPETKVTSLTQEGGMYTFIMPDDDVVLNAEYEGVSADIPIPHFRAMFQILYDSTITSFGPEDTVPNQNVELFRIKYMTLWKSGNKICWHSSGQGGKVKFAAGSMANLFKDCSTLQTVDLTGFVTSKVNNMSGMFQNCTNLTSVTLDNETYAEQVTVDGKVKKAGQYVNFDTSAVEDMSYMFSSSDFSGSNVNNTKMKFTSLDCVAGFNTSNVENMGYMFYLCSNSQLQSIPVAGFDTSKVSDMNHMFACYKNAPSFVTSLDLRNWDFSEVTTIANMFDRCESLNTGLLFPGETGDPENPDLSKAANFKKLTTMDHLFSQCMALTHDKLKSVVSTWKFSGREDDWENTIYARDEDIPSTGNDKGKSTSMFGNYEKDNPGINSAANYIIRSEMVNKQDKHFKDRNTTGYETRDTNSKSHEKYKLYIGGGTSIPNLRLTTKASL